MKSIRITFTLVVIALVGHTTTRAQDPLPSWNDGPTKQAIVDFVRTTTEAGGARFVPPEERIATFDQDGTLWVEHPVYTQLIYCLDRVPVLAKEKPELKNIEPFKTVLSGDLEAITIAADAFRKRRSECSCGSAMPCVGEQLNGDCRTLGAVARVVQIRAPVTCGLRMGTAQGPSR